MLEELDDIKWFLIIFAILWVVWFFTGGPARFENKPFIKPAAPIDTGETYR
jgi:hypothetical protein